MTSILADDLSGAQEALAAIVRLPSSARSTEIPQAQVFLTEAPEHALREGAVAIDLDTRQRPFSDARFRTRRALDALAIQGRSASSIFFKFDSLLRGSIEPQLQELRRRIPVVFCPAVPRLNRTVENGVVFVNGTPLPETDLWRVENGEAPTYVTDVLGSIPHSSLSLNEIRSCDLPALLRELAVGPNGEQRIIVADAVTDTDLDTVCSATTESGFALAGAAGLAAALGRRKDRHQIPNPVRAGNRGTLFVIGTAATSAKNQVSMLSNLGIPVFEWSPGTAIPRSSTDQVVVIGGEIDAAVSGRLVDLLSREVATATGDRDLFLTGGQTAHAVLSRMKINQLQPVSAPEHGTVVSMAPDGRRIVIRPGSFGSINSLVNTLNHLRDFPVASERTLP